MALIYSGTLSADSTVSTKIYNSRDGKPNVYTAEVRGNFGSGTVTAKLSTNGTNFENILDQNNNAVTFTSAGRKSQNFEINSDPINPIYLGFTIAGSTNPSVTVKVFDAG